VTWSFAPENHILVWQVFHNGFHLYFLFLLLIPEWMEIVYFKNVPGALALIIGLGRADVWCYQQLQPLGRPGKETAFL
jgi:hypothetical protein